MVAVHGKPCALRRRKPFERNSFGFICCIRVCEEDEKKKCRTRSDHALLTGVLPIVPMERCPKRISRVHLVLGHTAVLTKRVNRLIPPYGTVGHTDFLSVVSDRRAR